MARIATAPQAARSGSTPPIFETYLEARQEANRRTQDKAEGVVVRVVKSPYGRGYVLRHVPLEVMSDPDFGQAAFETGRRLAYRDL